MQFLPTRTRFLPLIAAAVLMSALAACNKGDANSSASGGPGNSTGTSSGASSGGSTSATIGADNGSEFWPQHLDGDFAIVLDVVCEVHGGHATSTKLAIDRVAVGERGGQTVQ